MRVVGLVRPCVLLAVLLLLPGLLAGCVVTCRGPMAAASHRVRFAVDDPTGFTVSLAVGGEETEFAVDGEGKAVIEQPAIPGCGQARVLFVPLERNCPKLRVVLRRDGKRMERLGLQELLALPRDEEGWIVVAP